MSSRQRPAVVSADDVALGRYSICDVVLPLPGSSIVYPDNDTKQVACLCLKHLSTSLGQPFVLCVCHDVGNLHEALPEALALV